MASGGYYSGNFAKISIDNIEIKMPRNINKHYRGLHILTLDPVNGAIKEKRVFDTYDDGDLFDEFLATKLDYGDIVAVACKDECISELTDKAKKWFENLGSNEIWYLAYRESFAFIGVHGKFNAVDKRSKDECGRVKDSVEVTMVFQVLKG